MRDKTSVYAQLEARIAQGEALLLDGAVGTQLQRLGVPMDNLAWAAPALATHPDSVRRMHRQYLELGADIITTNTFSSARHNLEAAGLGHRTGELNRRAVELAREAREPFADAAAIAIAGSVSHFGILAGGEGDLARHDHEVPGARADISEQQARSNIREQAEILVAAGVDLLLLESTGNMRQREWLLQETDHLAIPRWLGFRCRLDPGDATPRIGYGSAAAFADGLRILDRYPVQAVAIFHSLVAATTAALPILQRYWDGMIALYPEAGRGDYTATCRDDSETSNISPVELPALFRRWIDMGVQVVGGCCGIDVEYYAGLKTELARR